MASPFRLLRRVDFAETDMAGMAHFSNFFRWMEAAEVAFLRSLGLSVTLEWEGRKVSFPRVSARCDFRRPARFEDEIAIAVTVKQVGRTSVTYAFEFFRGDDSLATGEVSSVCCRVEPGQPLTPIPLPPPLRAKLEECQQA